jgi:hypothetical protein
MSSAFIVIVSILCAIGLPWFIGIPLAFLGFGFVVRRKPKDQPEGAQSSLEGVNRREI